MFTWLLSCVQHRNNNNTNLLWIFTLLPSFFKPQVATYEYLRWITTLRHLVIALQSKHTISELIAHTLKETICEAYWWSCSGLKTFSLALKLLCLLRHHYCMLTSLLHHLIKCLWRVRHQNSLPVITQRIVSLWLEGFVWDLCSMGNAPDRSVFICMAGSRCRCVLVGHTRLSLTCFSVWF